MGSESETIVSWYFARDDKNGDGFSDATEYMDSNGVISTTTTAAPT